MFIAIPPVVMLDTFGVDVLSVDPGRSFSIICSSIGDFPGPVRWEYIDGTEVTNIGMLIVPVAPLI